MPRESIRVRGARQNNLKDLDIDLPLGELIGSGLPRRSPLPVVLFITLLLGIFAGEDLVTFRRVSSGVARTGDELAVLIAALCRGHNQLIARAGRIILSSVVPALKEEGGSIVNVIS